MKREQIIAIVVVLLLFAGAGAGYQFYFRPALEKFSEDQQYLAALKTKLNSLKTTFPGGHPETAVARVVEKTQPWQSTLEQRARQFSIRDFMKIEELPKTSLLKAYYAQTCEKMVNDLYTELLVKGVYFQPPRAALFFNMPQAENLTAKTVNENQVNYWLSTIKLGTSITRMLVDAEILGVENISMWPPHASADGFTSYSFGVSMWMTLDQFCKFIEKLYGEEDMCITVQGFRMTNSALRAYQDPPLHIELVFTIDTYTYEPTPVKAAGGAAGNNLAAQMKAKRGSAAGAKPTVTKKSWWQSLLPW